MLENKVSTAEEVLMQHYDTNYRSNYKEGISTYWLNNNK